jgi:GNAT superfamily N-acetyltransferase
MDPADNNADIQTDTSPAALARAVDENDIAYWLYRARHAGWEVGSPTGGWRQEPGLLLYVSGLERSPWSNSVLRTNLSPAEADARIAATVASFRMRGLAFTWYAGPSRTPADLAARLEAHGLTLDTAELGMASDLTVVAPPVSAPAGLTIERVRDDAGALRLLVVSRLANDLDPDISTVAVERVTPATYDDDDPLQFYLAWLDGQPVACTQLFLGAGVAGIYNVGTIPSARRQGVGAAITLAALNAARERGYRIAVLGASAMGEPVYRRLGFTECTQVVIYAWQPAP